MVHNSYFTRATLAFIVAVLTVSSACKFITKKDIRREQTVPGIFVQNSFALERGATGKELILRFATTVQANCEIKFWVQAGGAVPPSDASVQKCAVDKPEKEFSLTISDLKSELYFIEVSAWPVDGNASSSSRVIVKESEQINKEGGGFVVARLNVPLATIDVVRTRDEFPQSLLMQKDKIGKCEKNVESFGFFAVKNLLDSSSFSNVRSTGFLAANSAGLGGSDSTAAARLRGDSARSDEPLTMDFAYFGRPERVSLTVPSLIVSAAISSVDTLNFPKPQLAVAEREILDINASTDLRFSWSLANSSPESIAIVSLGFSGQGDTVTCVFDASQGTGIVPAEVVQLLPAGKHDVSLSILSKSKLDRDQNRSVPWTIVTNDWRLARIQKL